MASDFRLLAGFPEHHKTQMMIERLGTGSVYHWLCLLAWSTRNRTSGDFYGMTPEHIELHAKWPDFLVKKEPYKGRRSRGLLVEVLLEVRFLESDELGLKWHDWESNQPYVSKEQYRIQIAQNAAASKKAKREQAMIQAHQRLAQEERIHEEGNSTTLSGKQLNSSPETVQPPSLPNLTKPNQSQKQSLDAAKRGQEKRGTRIPDDFKVENHHREFARREGLVSPDLEIGAFIDHFRAKPGKDGVKLDWHGTFRNWLRNSRRNGTSNGNQLVNRGRTRQELQRMEFERAEEMDSQGTLDSGGDGEGNGHGGGLKRLCESVDRPIPATLEGRIPPRSDRT